MSLSSVFVGKDFFPTRKGFNLHDKTSANFYFARLQEKKMKSLKAADWRFCLVFAIHNIFSECDLSKAYITYFSFLVGSHSSK